MSSACDTVSAESPALRLFSRCVGGLAVAAQALAAVGILFCLVAIGAAVVLRYGFNAAPLWVDEAVGFALIAIVMLSAAQSLRQGEHIAVDLLVSRLGPLGRRRMILWSMFAALLVAIILIYNGWQSIELARMLGLLTEGYLEWPTWMLMCLLPVGGLLLGLAAIEIGWRAWVGAPLPAGGHGAIDEALQDAAAPDAAEPKR